MALNRISSDGHPLMFVQGNEACVQGALHAGCRFFAGYPITPSTEIAEGMARELPKLGGTFIQMEDEIASIAAIIGASAAGARSMTATSGPGISLMLENIGFAYMIQMPVVVVNVQRGGPSTGLPTKLSQSDTMQARWGTHGDFTSIALAASTVQEVYDMTIRAFEVAERFSTPVFLLLDELIGHMREKVVLNKHDNQAVVKHAFPEIPPEWYLPYTESLDLVSHPAPFGEGYRYNMTGLVHDRAGFPTSIPAEITERLETLRNKILKHKREIWQLREHYTEDAKYIIIAYGSAARAARGAVESLRLKKTKAGLIDLKSIWPFPDEPIKEILDRCNIKSVIVAENNMGQLIHPVREMLGGSVKIASVNRYDGHPLEPQEIINVVKEEIYA
ncbi:2-oxoacid:acceptor oxidoreductase subunit alpha [bacterium]|nr:MAG: 2-oxoacid:acceptor oxidoreductase subunit alpha [bacterium]